MELRYFEMLVTASRNPKVFWLHSYMHVLSSDALCLLAVALSTSDTWLSFFFLPRGAEVEMAFLAPAAVTPHSATLLLASCNRIPCPLLGHIFITSQPISRHTNSRSIPHCPIDCFLI